MEVSTFGNQSSDRGNFISGWKYHNGTKRHQSERKYQTRSAGGGGGGGGGGSEVGVSVLPQMSLIEGFYVIGEFMIEPIVIHALFIRYLITKRGKALVERISHPCQRGHLVLTIADSFDMDVIESYGWAGRIASLGTMFTSIKPLLCKESVAALYGVLHEKRFQDQLFKRDFKDSTIIVCEAGDATGQMIQGRIEKSREGLSVVIVRKHGIVGRAGGGYIDKKLAEIVLSKIGQRDKIRTIYRDVYQFKTSQDFLGTIEDGVEEVANIMNGANHIVEMECLGGHIAIPSEKIKEMYEDQAVDRLKLLEQCDFDGCVILFTGGAYRPKIARDLILSKVKPAIPDRRVFFDPKNVFTSVGGALSFVSLLGPNIRAIKKTNVDMASDVSFVTVNQVDTMPSDLMIRMFIHDQARYVMTRRIIEKGQAIGSYGYYPSTGWLDGTNAKSLKIIIFLDTIYDCAEEPKTYYITRVNIPTSREENRLRITFSSADVLRFSIHTKCSIQRCEKTAEFRTMLRGNVCSSHRQQGGKTAPISSIDYQLNMFSGKNGRDGLLDFIGATEESCKGLNDASLDKDTFFRDLRKEVDDQKPITKDFQTSIVDRCAAFEDAFESGPLKDVLKRLASSSSTSSTSSSSTSSSSSSSSAEGHEEEGDEGVGSSPQQSKKRRTEVENLTS